MFGGERGYTISFLAVTKITTMEIKPMSQDLARSKSDLAELSLALHRRTNVIRTATESKGMNPATKCIETPHCNYTFHLIARLTFERRLYGNSLCGSLHRGQVSGDPRQHQPQLAPPRLPPKPNPHSPKQHAIVGGKANGPCRCTRWAPPCGLTDKPIHKSQQATPERQVYPLSAPRQSSAKARDDVCKLAITALRASSQTGTQTAPSTREQQSYRQQAPRQSGALA